MGPSLPGNAATGTCTVCVEIGGGDFGCTMLRAKYTEPSTPKTIKNDVRNERLSWNTGFCFLEL